jgi:hypothetical protein
MTQQEESNKQLEALFKKNLDPIKASVDAVQASVEALRVSTEESIDDIMIFLNDTVATKEDLKAFATKEDLKQFATKEDLERFAAETRVEFIDVRYQMSDMHADIKRIDKKIDDNTAILRHDIATVKKMATDDIIAVANDVKKLKQRAL